MTFTIKVLPALSDRLVHNDSHSAENCSFRVTMETFLTTTAVGISFPIALMASRLILELVVWAMGIKERSDTPRLGSQFRWW